MADVTTTKVMCRQLRSKGMYVYGTMDPADSGVPGAGDGYCWCLKTMHQFGPDSQGVDRDQCRPGRRCFEPME
jgi:hypothetical protein